MRSEARLAASCLVAVALSSCRKPEPEPRLPPPRPTATVSAPRPPEPPRTGALTEGTLTHEGLRVPTGFTRTLVVDRTATFDGNADAPRLVDYVRVRLASSRFTPLGDGGTFTSAVPRGADARRVKLRIRVLSLGPNRASLQITSQPTEAAPPANDAERMRTLDAERRGLD